MGQYWIRSRGRVQGPFTEDRIQGLLRRGRFSRHFHVSEDRKNWYPAGDFPELFAGVGSAEPDIDDTPFRSGGSPFDDDDDLAPTRVKSGKKQRGGKRQRVVEEDEEEEDDDDNENEDWEDDEDWDDDDSGALGGLINWVEANTKLVAGVLVVLVLGLGWFVFGRESFKQDAADLEQLIEIKTKISSAHSMGTNVDDWLRLSSTTEADLASMVSRLQDSASAKDHVKQELLFAARDDIPKMFDQLPKGNTEAEQSVSRRFSRIDQMIKDKVRQHQDSVLTLPAAPPVQQPATPTVPAEQETIPGSEQLDPGEPAPNTETPGSDPAMQTPGGQPSSPSNNGQPNGSSSQPGAGQGMNAVPGMPSNTGQPAPNGTSPPNANQSNNVPGNIPGRPKPAKF